MFSKTFHHPDNPFSLKEILNSWGYIEAPHTFKYSFLNLVEHPSRGLYDWKIVIKYFTGTSIMLITLLHDKKPRIDDALLWLHWPSKTASTCWNTPHRASAKLYYEKKWCIMFSRTFYHPNNFIPLWKTRIYEAPYIFKNKLPRPTSKASG